jgi:hypothetical protein
MASVATFVLGDHDTEIVAVSAESGLMGSGIQPRSGVGADLLVADAPIGG